MHKTTRFYYISGADGSSVFHSCVYNDNFNLLEKIKSL